MGKLGAPDFSLDVKGQIVGMWRAGYRTVDIVRDLNVSFRTVKRYITCFNEEGNVATHPRSGAPRVTTEAIRRAIVGVVEDSGFVTAGRIRRQLQLPISDQTVRKCLHEGGYHGHKPAKKPRMTQAHKDTRVQFAQRHLH
ncbi:uncharacterized protein LOC107043158 [Diachasma alloeum]|uniref:uncharacterized protein LOC107043158 n=1 Tax=Diachasma alloeum TaxID=454923 RepID=UPI0007382FBB|nr:uncharacterized protein LOC107043158 [Diachasma alloeum]